MPEDQADEVDRQDEHHGHDPGIDQHRFQRVDAAEPAASRVLYVELLEQADAGADHDCVEDAVDRVPPERKGRQHRQQAENDNGQQDRR
jgi:hypothetical protein